MTGGTTGTTGTGTSSKDKFQQMIRSWIDQFAHVLQSTDTKEFIQVLVLDPFLKHIMGQIFPYILIGFCLFAAVFIMVILMFVMMLFKRGSDVPSGIHGMCPFCGPKGAM
jgi:hypothetical protein